MAQHITMSDVARRAGVTRATVSFVINQRAADLRISDDTQRKVRAAIEALNYRVNSAAQSTSRGRSFGIGVMAPGGSRLTPAWSEQVEGIHAAAEARGYHLVYVGADESKLSDPAYAPKIIRENLVDGVIFLISGAPAEAMDRVIRRYRIPTVWIQRRRRCDALWLDEAAFVEESVAHLAALQHRRICLLDSSDDLGTLWSEQRRAGFVEAMRRARLRPRIETLHGAAAVGELKQLLEEPERPTAFLAGTPVFATYLVLLAPAAGLQVPNDLAVVAVSNATEAARSIPTLTRWDNDLQGLGFEAGRMLIERIELKAPRPARTLRGRLYPGGTTGPYCERKNP